MVEGDTHIPFQNLPEALVEDMLDNSERLSENLSTYFRDLELMTEEVRTKLTVEGLLYPDTEILRTVSHPTACGIDGAYSVERLLATDIVAIAGLAIEGLTPPSEESFWPEPRHDAVVTTAEHSDATTVVTRNISSIRHHRLGLQGWRRSREDAFGQVGRHRPVRCVDDLADL